MYGEGWYSVWSPKNFSIHTKGKRFSKTFLLWVCLEWEETNNKTYPSKRGKRTSHGWRYEQEEGFLPIGHAGQSTVDALQTKGTSHAILQSTQSSHFRHPATWNKPDCCLSRLSRWLLSLHDAGILGLLQSPFRHHTCCLLIPGPLTSTVQSRQYTSHEHHHPSST